jgi:hypothetical protein
MCSSLAKTPSRPEQDLQGSVYAGLLELAGKKINFINFIKNAFLADEFDDDDNTRICSIMTKNLFIL